MPRRILHHHRTMLVTIRRAGLITAAVALVLLAGAAATNAASLPTLQPVVLPRDHGAHPAFQVEWWYTAGTVAAPGGRDYFWFATVWTGLGYRLAKVNVVDLRADRIILSREYIATGALRAGQTHIQVGGFSLGWRRRGPVRAVVDGGHGPGGRTPAARPDPDPTLRAQRHRRDRAGGPGRHLGLLLRPAAGRTRHARAQRPPNRDRRPGLV